MDAEVAGTTDNTTVTIY